LAALDPCLGLTPAQKQRTVLRSDAGFGGDANVNHGLTAGWQVLAKGKGGRRPQAYARQVGSDDWQALQAGRWVAHASAPPTYACPTHLNFARK
jgi:hypothetical protein